MKYINYSMSMNKKKKKLDNNNTTNNNDHHVSSALNYWLEPFLAPKDNLTMT